MKSRPHCLAGIFLISCLSALAQFTGTYVFQTAVTDVPSVTNVTFTSLQGTNVSLSYSGPNQNTSTSQWVLNGVSADTAEYLSFSVSSNFGYNLSLSQISFSQSRSNTGPASIAVGLYLNSILQATSSTFSTTNTTNGASSAMVTQTFDFGDINNIPSTSAVQFRIYGWGGSNSGGTLRLDNIAVSGNVALAPVPEPSTYAAIFGAVALVAVVVQRRRSKGCLSPVV